MIFPIIFPVIISIDLDNKWENSEVEWVNGVKISQTILINNQKIIVNKDKVNLNQDNLQTKIPLISTISISPPQIQIQDIIPKDKKKLKMEIKNQIILIQMKIHIMKKENKNFI